MSKYQIGDTKLFVEPTVYGFEVLQRNVTQNGKGAGNVYYEFKWHFGTLEGLINFLPAALLAQLEDQEGCKASPDLLVQYKSVQETLRQMKDLLEGVPTR